MMRWFAHPATKAGQKAGKAWQHILEQTDEETETLTGGDLYTHAKEEAKNWLRSHHKIEHRYLTEYEFNHPEQSHHEEFLEYVEAFVSAFPPRTQGYPKGDYPFDYLEEELP